MVSFFGTTDTPDSPERLRIVAESMRRPAQRPTVDVGCGVTRLNPRICTV